MSFSEELNDFQTKGGSFKGPGLIIAIILGPIFVLIGLSIIFNFFEKIGKPDLTGFFLFPLIFLPGILYYLITSKEQKKWFYLYILFSLVLFSASFLYLFIEKEWKINIFGLIFVFLALLYNFYKRQNFKAKDIILFIGLLLDIFFIAVFNLGALFIFIIFYIFLILPYNFYAEQNFKAINVILVTGLLIDICLMIFFMSEWIYLIIFFIIHLLISAFYIKTFYNLCSSKTSKTIKIN
jgi:hypothetical protein